ncbi:MAG: hypothetical protein AAF805_09355 [Planctomycetota bacterium]
MGYTIKEDVRARRCGQDDAERHYLIDWDRTGVTSPELARSAMVAHVDRLVENRVTKEIRQLGVSEQPAAVEARLSYQLHGFAAAKADVVENDPLGLTYRGVTRYGRRTRVERQQDAAAALRDAVTDSAAEARVLVSRKLGATVRGGAIDHARLIYLFSRQEASNGSALPPAFPPGAINAVEDDSGGVVKVRGLDYSAPPTGLSIDLEVTGAVVDSAFALAILDAAEAGTFNTAAFNIGGVSFAPYTLLLCSARFNTTPIGKTTIALEFAKARTTSLPIDRVGGHWRAEMGAYVDGNPTFGIFRPASIPTEATTAIVSGLDYVWQFRSKQATSEGGASLDVTRVENVSVNRPWAEADYQGLLGVSSL